MLRVIEVLLLAYAAVRLGRFWARTRLWLPRYVHGLAALALVISLACLVVAPPDAPARKGVLQRLLVVVVLPALVYGVFILKGGQQAAYQRTHAAALARCSLCGRADVRAGSACPACRQRAG